MASKLIANNFSEDGLQESPKWNERVINGECLVRDLKTREEALEVILKVNEKIALITFDIDAYHDDNPLGRDAKWLRGAKLARAMAYTDREAIEFRIKQLKDEQKAINIARSEAHKRDILTLVNEEAEKMLGTEDYQILHERVRERVNA